MKKPWDGCSPIMLDDESGRVVRSWDDLLSEMPYGDPCPSLPRMWHASEVRPDLPDILRSWAEETTGEDDDAMTTAPKEVIDALTECQAKIDAVAAWWWYPTRVAVEWTEGQIEHWEKLCQQRSRPTA